MTRLRPSLERVAGRTYEVRYGRGTVARRADPAAEWRSAPTAVPGARSFEDPLWLLDAIPFADELPATMGEHGITSCLLDVDLAAASGSIEVPREAFPRRIHARWWVRAEPVMLTVQAEWDEVEGLRRWWFPLPLRRRAVLGLWRGTRITAAA